MILIELYRINFYIKVQLIIQSEYDLFVYGMILNGKLIFFSIPKEFGNATTIFYYFEFMIQ